VSAFVKEPKYEALFDRAKARKCYVGLRVGPKKVIKRGVEHRDVIGITIRKLGSNTLVYSEPVTSTLEDAAISAMAARWGEAA
jgi:hypothetical protein